VYYLKTRIRAAGCSYGSQAQLPQPGTDDRGPFPQASGLLGALAQAAQLAIRRCGDASPQLAGAYAVQDYLRAEDVNPQAGVPSTICRAKVRRRQAPTIASRDHFLHRR